MRQAELQTLLRAVKRGRVTPGRAAKRIAEAPLERLEFAALDHQRALRNGFPEVVFGLGKSPEQMVAIVRRLHARHGVVLATRVEPAAREALLAEFPRAEVHERARCVVLRKRAPRPRGRGPPCRPGSPGEGSASGESSKMEGCATPPSPWPR